MSFEYTVIPAPTRTKRQKGVKTAAERLAFAMEDSINEMASDGWEYLRTDTLTVEDKAGLFSKIVEKIETVLVFRKPVETNRHIMPKREAVENLEIETQSVSKVRTKEKAMADDAGVTPSLGGVSRD